MKLLFLLFLGTILIQQLYYWVFYARAAFARWVPKEKLELNEPVSIVICGKNAAEQFAQHLPEICAQNFPEFEIIVVDDHSTDHTVETVTQLANQYPQIRLVTKDLVPDRAGKKEALNAGVQQAKHQIIAVTDADCSPASEQWLSQLVSYFSTPEIELVLGISPNTKSKGFWKGFFEFETVWTALNYISFTKSGMPYMGVGRNMAFRKSFFDAHFPKVLASDFASGDDDLLVNIGSTSKNTVACLNPSAFTYSDSPKNLPKWFQQKTRHLTSGSSYKWYHQVLLSLFPINQLIYYGCFIAILFTPIWAGAILFGLLNMTLQSVVHALLLSKMRQGHLALMLPIYQFIWVAFLPIISLSSRFKSKQTWS